MGVVIEHMILYTTRVLVDASGMHLAATKSTHQLACLVQNRHSKHVLRQDLLAIHHSRPTCVRPQCPNVDTRMFRVATAKKHHQVR